MAYIEYLPENQQPKEYRVDDRDNIIQISAVHSQFMKRHHDLYTDLMLNNRGPLGRVQREMIGVLVSALNGCHY